MTEQVEITEKPKAKKEKECPKPKKIKMVKVGVKDKAAFDSHEEGSCINLWGNQFAVGPEGQLEAAVPKNIADEGIKIGRYVKI